MCNSIYDIPVRTIAGADTSLAAFKGKVLLVVNVASKCGLTKQYDGLEKLYAHGCDLILTDINMAHMDGYEFIRRIRAEPRYGELPIIIVSTESQSMDRLKGFQAGANLYLVKPCSPQMMIENLRMVLPGDSDAT